MKKINKYIIFDFIKLFIVLYLSIFCLVFIADFLEFSRKIKFDFNSFFVVCKIVLFRAPKILEDFVQFLVLLASAITLKKYVARSEMTIMQMNGVSLWKIIKIFSGISIALSVLIITIFNPIALHLNKIAKKAELSYFKKEQFDFVESANGIWLKQNDTKNNQKAIIRSSKVYLNDYSFVDNIIIVLDENNKFIKRLNIENMKLEDMNWKAYNINQVEYLKPIQHFDEMVIATNITQEFVKQQLQNKYENVSQMSFYKLVNLTKEFKKVGLPIKKFVIQQNIFLTKPFVFIMMSMIACLVIKNTNRKDNTIFEIFVTVVIGILLFIVQNIIFELTMAQKLSHIFAIWGWIVFVYLVLFYLLIKKIELSNINFKK